MENSENMVPTMRVIYGTKCYIVGGRVWLGWQAEYWFHYIEKRQADQRKENG